jgi:hypothetical protein
LSKKDYRASGRKFSMSGSTNVVFSPGQVYRRRDMHEKLGGQRQGGISTPAKAPFTFLITGDSGKRHGYSNEWTDDGVFLYTGEGQRGDMKFVGGNRAIRDHLKDGKALQVFEVGYDLRCDRGNEQAHIEGKGTQGNDVCFIITAPLRSATL